MSPLSLGHLTVDEDQRVLVRIIRGIDWWLLLAVAVLVGYGLTGISSATLRFGSAGGYYTKQLVAVGLGAVGMLLMTLLNYQLYRQIDRFVMGFLILILVGVLIFGTTVRGSKSWYNLHFFAFQPAELGKILIILVLASFLDKQAKQMKRLKTIMVPVFIVFFTVGLILLQPDFSSSLPYFPILLGMLFVAGARGIHLVSLLSFGAIALGIPLLETYIHLQYGAVPGPTVWRFIAEALRGGWPALIALGGLMALISLGWFFLWQWQIRIPRFYLFCTLVLLVGSIVSSLPVRYSLKEYQRKRLIVFLNPDKDPFGAGYNLNQSKIAIGSGGIFGKGLFSGTQGQLGFLPERHTDFIFSVIGEELGFVGAGLLLGFFGLFFWRCVAIARGAHDRYGSLVSVGVLCLFAFPVVINIGMGMGMMPITGIALPFLSYGGSAMVSSLLAVGLLLSIHIRRYTYY